MFELLFVLSLILCGALCAVLLTVGLFKLFLGLLLLPVKIVGFVLHFVVSLVVGVIGLVVALVFLPVAVVMIPILIAVCVLALPLLFIWGLFHLAF